MGAPVRFETVAKRLQVDVAVVLRWSQLEGFPAAGDGVADPDAVDQWALDGNHWAALVDSPAPELAAAGSAPEPSAPAPELDADSGIAWVTIRVPVKIDAPRLPGSNPYQTIRLKSSEHHIRRAMGQLHHGCRESHQQMGTGELVDKISQSCKWIFEQVALEIQKMNTGGGV